MQTCYAAARFQLSSLKLLRLLILSVSIIPAPLSLYLTSCASASVVPLLLYGTRGANMLCRCAFSTLVSQTTATCKHAMPLRVFNSRFSNKLLRLANMLCRCAFLSFVSQTTATCKHAMRSFEGVASNTIRDLRVLLPPRMPRAILLPWKTWRKASLE